MAIAQDITTDITVTNEKTNAETNAATAVKFKTTIAGVPTTFTATEVHGQGGLENKLDKLTSGGIENEHYIHVHELVLEYNHVTVPGCEVLGLPGKIKEKVVTKNFTATTTEKGDAIVLSAEAGASTPLAEFELVGPEAFCLGTIKVFGTIKATLDGATISTTHEDGTTGGPGGKPTMKIQNAITGPRAGLEGTVTVSGNDTVACDPSYTPLSPTTVETP